MKAALIAYDGMTSLDFFGFYDTFTRLQTMSFVPDFSWDICSYEKKFVQEQNGVAIKTSVIKPFLGNYNLVFIPGGLITRELEKDKDFIAWIKTAESCMMKVSVCSGALILGAAGFLKGKKATTHPAAYKDLLRYAEVEKKRIVECEDVITAAGVTASIDLGLYVVKKIAGEQVFRNIKKQMDYPYGDFI